MVQRRAIRQEQRHRCRVHQLSTWGIGLADLTHLGDEFATSNINGTLDQIAALQWVQNNIAALVVIQIASLLRVNLPGVSVSPH